MRLFNKSSNPMFDKESVSKVKAIAVDRDKKRSGGPIVTESDTFTVDGAVNKTITLGLILMCTSLYSYMFPSQIFATVGALGGAAIYFFTSFKPHLAPITAPIYALVKGLFVGSVSYAYASRFAGTGFIDSIIFQALSLTIATLLSMMMIYKSGLIKVTKKFRMVVSMAVMAIMMVYLLSWIGSFAGFTIPYLHESGVIGIGITVFIIVVAALNLLLDFDNFDKGEQMQAPKYMEWYFGMGLLFTLIWLYVEFLRLLGKLQSD